jgi:hypothetical protein
LNLDGERKLRCVLTPIRVGRPARRA